MCVGFFSAYRGGCSYYTSQYIVLLIVVLVKAHNNGGGVCIPVEVVLLGVGHLLKLELSSLDLHLVSV